MSRYRLMPTPEQMVQQQAVRDFAQAMASYFAGTHGKPTWRKQGRNEGFRIVAIKPGHIRRLSRKTGEVRVPKTGWLRFRWSRAVPDAKSYRVTLDRAGRWHIAFAAIPKPVPDPGTGEVVGLDRGVAVSAALSTGELLHCPALRPAERSRLRRLQRKLARGQKGSNRRGRVKAAIATLKAREADRRKDWAEKTSTRLARSYDLIRIEDLNITAMTRSARGKIRPAFTSQRCSACGRVAAGSRESQALFCCASCGYASNADVNAAKNIAAGHAVNARGGDGTAQPANREPHPLLLSA